MYKIAPEFRYEAIGTPAEQIDMLEKIMGFDLYRQPPFIAAMVAVFLFQMGYLVFIGRYFKPTREAGMD